MSMALEGAREVGLARETEISLGLGAELPTQLLSALDLHVRHPERGVVGVIWIQT